jgi:hypothetical protein
MNKKKILPVTIAAILASSIFASGVSPVFASQADTSKATMTAQQKKAEKSMVKVSQDALISLRDLQSARFAIFNGEIDRAQTYVDAAKTRIAVADEEAENYALDIKAPKSDDWYVPFDATFAVMDTYKVTDAKAKHIESANRHFRRGEQKEALETLKLNDIDVAVSTGLLPVKFARAHIDQASELVREGKYYEANLELKSVGDAIIVQTFDVDAVPKLASKHPKMGSKG